MADQLEVRFSIDEHHDLALKRSKWQVGMRAEAALARQPQQDVRQHVECSSDFRARCIELRPCSRYIPAERPEGIGVQAIDDLQTHAKEPLGQRRNHVFLAVHCGKQGTISEVQASSDSAHLTPSFRKPVQFDSLHPLLPNRVRRGSAMPSDRHH